MTIMNASMINKLQGNLISRDKHSYRILERKVHNDALNELMEELLNMDEGPELDDDFPIGSLT